MLTCIACSKHLNGGGGSLQPQPEEQQDEDDVVAAATPSRKQAIKALTTQIKGMAIKASGAYKNCKPCAGGRSENRRRKFADFDINSGSERFNCAYRRTGSSDSTPRTLGKELEARIKSISSGEGTPVSLSGRAESVVFVEDDEPKEWVAQVEPGVLITFVSMPQGGNDLKRIRFSRELFNKWQAQRWWAENYDKVMELYNVQKFNQQAAPPSYSEDEVSKMKSNEGGPATPPLSKESLPRNFHHVKAERYSSTESVEHHRTTRGQQYYNDSSCGLTTTPKLSNLSMARTETSSVDASARSSLSRDVDHSGELSMSNASDVETEWVEQDEPGVYITIRALPDGARELRRVRFSRERFGEMQARSWWEENKARIQEQYL